MELMDMILDLEAELTTERRGLFKKIDLEKCLQILDAMKTAYPELLREAAYIVNAGEKILQNADAAAKNTLREAEKRAESLVDNSELLRRAETEAKKLYEQTVMQCDAYAQRARESLEANFKEIENFLTEELSVVRNNREQARGSMIINTDRGA